MNVSVLFTSFNRSHLLPRTLASILPQLIDGDEIIIVNDYAPDMQCTRVLAEAIVAYKSPHVMNLMAQVFTTNNSRYRGAAHAKNIAVKKATKEICIINDPEVIQQTSCIVSWRQRLEYNPRDFVVAGDMLFETDTNTINQIKQSQAPFVAAVKREELLAVGGWDERYIYWGNDDNDLMYRLGLNGVRHIVDTTMTGLHQWHERPPAYAMGDCNDSLMAEKDRPIIANQQKEWGVL